MNHKPVGGERNITAAVFLPELPTVNYTITETNSLSIKNYFTRSDKEYTLSDITEKLFANEADHTCFFIFLYQWKDEPTYESYHSNFLGMILDALKTR